MLGSMRPEHREELDGLSRPTGAMIREHRNILDLRTHDWEDIRRLEAKKYGSFMF